MLISAFNKESDSVFVDLLTGSDLEALKARKMGGNTTSSTTANLSISSSQVSGVVKKRYIILTYSGEFDRVHYPLPLPFEDTPNPSALRRTISRLRKQLEYAKKGNDTVLDTSSDKDLRIMITQLRQENTELRHRLRQLQGKGANKQPDTATTDLTIANTKLKKQVDILRKDIVEAGIVGADGGVKKLMFHDRHLGGRSSAHEHLHGRCNLRRSKQLPMAYPTSSSSPSDSELLLPDSARPRSGKQTDEFNYINVLQAWA
jgi:coiled-coil domain-containing protein 61